MRIKTLHLAVLIPLLIFGSVLVTSALGLWQTKNDKIPAAFKEGEAAGQYNPADIRGSYTLADISQTFQIPLEDLGAAFVSKDPASYAAFKVKELEALYSQQSAQGQEIGTGSVRYFVALYKGLPYTATESTYLPSSAVEILKAKAKLSAEETAQLEKISVKLP